MDVKPWEAVMGGFVEFDIWPWNEDEYECREILNGLEPVLHVTLANGQRIIVRVLSDERKAARAAMKGSSHVVA